MINTITKEQIIGIIYECLDEVNEQLSGQERLEKAPGTALLGNQAKLDSLGFVNFIGLFEEKFEDRFKGNPCLSSQEDAFETVQDLTDLVYAKTRQM